MASRENTKKKYIVLICAHVLTVKEIKTYLANVSLVKLGRLVIMYMSFLTRQICVHVFPPHYHYLPVISRPTMAPTGHGFGLLVKDNWRIASYDLVAIAFRTWVGKGLLISEIFQFEAFSD